MTPMKLCMRTRLITPLSWTTNIHSGAMYLSCPMGKCPVLLLEAGTTGACLELAVCSPVIEDINGWADHLCSACPTAAGLDPLSVERYAAMFCLIDHGMYSCTRGFVVDSRCDYNCYEGYQIEGDRYRICQEEGTWSGTEPTCADHDPPPKLKCPLSRVKVAEPGKVTAMVSWERPVAKDTADRALQVLRNGLESGSDFPEGIHVIRYKVSLYTVTCKFTVHVEDFYDLCGTQILNPTDFHYISSQLHFRCTVVLLNRNWSDEAAQCVLMDIKTDVRSAGALLDKFYEKRRLLVVSRLCPDNANQKYRLQNIMLHKAECGLDLRHVTVIELLGTPPRAVGRIKEQLEPEVIEGLRQALHISTAYFTMVLLDEYGVDRERFVNPTTSDELYSYVEEYLYLGLINSRSDVVGGSFLYSNRHLKSLFPRQTII